MKLPIVIRIYKGTQLESVKQFSDSQIVVGTSINSQIQLKADTIAPLHTLIEERDSGFYISDLGSQTGTLFKGRKILDERIESGDSFLVGPYQIDFYIGIPKPMSPPSVETMGPGAVDVKAGIPPEGLNSEANASPPLISNVTNPVIREETVHSAAPSLTPEIKMPQSLPSFVGRSEGWSPPKESKENTKAFASHKNGTYAPPSEFGSLNEVLRPGKGTVVEVIVAWRERILSTYHFSERGMVKVGSNPGNQIILPNLGSNFSHSLVRIDSLATVCVSGEMSGELISEDGTKSFSELIRQNRLVRNTVGYEIGLKQGEMARVGIYGDLINLYVRYVPEAPKPLVAPLLDLTASEVTGVILAAVVALTFGLYMMVYAPKKLNDESLLEEPMRKALVIFNPPRPEPKEVVEAKVEPILEKKIVKIVEQKNSATVPNPTPKAVAVPAPAAKPSPKSESKENAGTPAQAKPNPNKTNKKNLTSNREGGAINTGKSGASPTSEKVDVSKVGLLGAFGSRGTQTKLDKAYSGAGELSGLADSATGFAGQAEDRAGDNIGSKLKSTGVGGKGSATVGIAGVGTTGKTSGAFGYGSGGIGKKSRVEVQVGGQDAEFVGSIDREAIRRVILAEKRVIRNCYEMALARSPDLYGKLVVQWDIEERGRVSNVVVVSTSLGDKSVVDCLVQRLKTWRFPEPPPDQVGRVTYPFVFTSQ